MSGWRLEAGGLIDRSLPVEFTFDGRRMQGFHGDTLASALLANGVSVVGRSFKYHRRRGIFTCGTEEPNALVTLGESDRTEPNCKAPSVELYKGLVARSQNRWPSLGVDLMATNQLFKPFLAAGFYYKTFIGPHRGAWRLYEPFIRHAAGMGRATTLPDPDTYECVNAFTDVVIIGAGPTGLMAALIAGSSGARTILLEERATLGGELVASTFPIDGAPAWDWVRLLTEKLARLSNVTVLSKTTAYGYYDDKLIAAVERVTDHPLPTDGQLLRQRHWKIRARKLILATGALERPVTFDNNDLPGVMLAASVDAYAKRFGVAAGRRIAFFVNNDSAYQALADLTAAGVEVPCVVDVRPTVDPALAELVRRAGSELLCGAVVSRAIGRLRLRSIEVTNPNSPVIRRIRADCLAVSGGWTPNVNLATQAHAELIWNADIAAFVPGKLEAGCYAGGAMSGRFDTASCLSDGVRLGAKAMKSLGLVPAAPTIPAVGQQWVATKTFPLWEVTGRRSCAFVDLQHDVTADDLRLAWREGFRSPEQVKRYTTLGMATDQGKTSNLAGAGILSSLSGRPIEEVGTTRFRPPCNPVSIGALAGNARGQFLQPIRRTPMHEWHVANGATMNAVGQWLRPLAYPRPDESLSRAALREALQVRRGVGIVDISTLGKIDVQGADAAEFLNRVYVNNWISLPVGKAKYGLMLREDGIVLDDGTTWRLGATRYLMTTTTANAARVLTHLEYLLAVAWPELRVSVTSVTDHWAAFAVAGPDSRALLQSVTKGAELSNDAFPMMHICEGKIGNSPVIICRLSFSGELAFEVYTGSGMGLEVWQQLTDAGRKWELVPYGTEALGILRIEKGHVSGPEIDGRTTADDLGLGGLVSKTKPSFVGKVLMQREGLASLDRLKLVGLISLTGKPLRAGSQIIAGSARQDQSLGHVSSATYSPALGKYIALALLQRGRQRLGERLLAVNPLQSTSVPVEVIDPHFYNKPEAHT